ncbi:hypothetical protein [Carnimonas bestiolae]|uniref:hypothetical protein n=1 Tax=Carnimonas bestiolae TaxID=3402172 RepID=UPI003EDB7B55
MGEVLMFPHMTRSTPQIANRHLTERERHLLKQVDTFSAHSRIFNEWLSRHDQRMKDSDRSWQALLADTAMLYQVASHEDDQLDLFSAQFPTRWAQLGYDALSDIELLVVCCSNLGQLSNGISDLIAKFPPECRDDLALVGLPHGFDQLARHIESLWNSPGTAVRPEGDLR